MTESTERPVTSSNPNVDDAFTAACGNVADNLVRVLHPFTRNYAEKFGKTPPMLIVLAGTGVYVALATAARKSVAVRPWSYSRETGMLHLHGSNTQAVICEWPDQHDWQVQITAPGIPGEPMILTTLVSAGVPA
jgi:hypothetical protein